MTRVALAIPAYNEAGGLPGFLKEIDSALGARADVCFVVADDASTDGTIDALDEVATGLAGELRVLAADRNEGHGPTLHRAYREALSTGAEVVVAVDGDGQFAGDDVRRVVEALGEEAAVCGVRRERVDPFLRLALTSLLRAYLRTVLGVRARDANCPLRGYRADRLRTLLAEVPEDSIVPNLQLTVLAARAGCPPVEVQVHHLPRRGSQVSGTMFDRGSTWRTTLRLARFSVQAFRETLRLR